jgi:hypothetical protein
MDIDQLRAQWSEVLDQLERENRMAWIAFFDARLAALENGVLTLDFSDATKFAGNLEYSQVRESHKVELQHAIRLITSSVLEIEEAR